MTLGSTYLGQPVIGATLETGTVLGFTAPAFALQPLADDLNIQSPLLIFLEITTAGGAKQRVVDFGDPEQAAQATSVTFNGHTWTSVVFQRPQETRSTEGRSDSPTVQIADPFFTIAGWIYANNRLEGAIVDATVIHYDNLAFPSRGETSKYRVKEVLITEEPRTVSITMGGPNDEDDQYPIIDYNRAGCSNQWEDRFTHGTLSFCNGHSDEFSEQTAQDFGESTAADTEQDFGWFSQNGNKATYFKTSQETINKDNLRIQTVLTATQLHNATRDAPFAYKEIVDVTGSTAGGDSDANVDFYTAFTFTSSSVDALGGLLVQSKDVPASWVFWGIRNNAGVLESVMKVTTAGVTVTVGALGGGIGTEYRLKRTGTTWEGYQRSSSTAAWDLKTTQTLSLTGTLRVGLVGGSQGAANASFTADFSFYRFLAGGFKECNRSLSHCTIRKNTHQRNGYLGLPNAI